MSRWSVLYLDNRKTGEFFLYIFFLVIRGEGFASGIHLYDGT